MSSEGAAHRPHTHTAATPPHAPGSQSGVLPHCDTGVWIHRTRRAADGKYLMGAWSSIMKSAGFCCHCLYCSPYLAFPSFFRRPCNADKAHFTFPPHILAEQPAHARIELLG